MEAELKQFNIMATKTGKKYIICDVATKKHGKTTFLKEVVKILTTHLGAGVVIAKSWRNDQCVVFTHKPSPKKILVQTKGDDADSFAPMLDHLKSNDVDIILCARHTQGITKKIVQYIATQYNFEELDFTHIHPHNLNWASPSVGITNSILSQAIYDILISL